MNNWKVMGFLNLEIIIFRLAKPRGLDVKPSCIKTACLAA